MFGHLQYPVTSCNCSAGRASTHCWCNLCVCELLGHDEGGGGTHRISRTHFPSCCQAGRPNRQPNLGITPCFLLVCESPRAFPFCEVRRWPGSARLINHIPALHQSGHRDKAPRQIKISPRPHNGAIFHPHVAASPARAPAETSAGAGRAECQRRKGRDQGRTPEHPTCPPSPWSSSSFVASIWPPSPALARPSTARESSVLAVRGALSCL